MTTMAKILEEAILIIDSIKKKTERDVQINRHQCQRLADRFQNVGCSIKRWKEANAPNGNGFHIPTHNEVAHASQVQRKNGALTSFEANGDEEIISSQSLLQVWVGNQELPFETFESKFIVAISSLLTVLKKGETLVTECMSADYISQVLVRRVCQEDFEEIHKELSLCKASLSFFEEGAEIAANEVSSIHTMDGPNQHVNDDILVSDARLDETELLKTDLKKLTTNTSFYSMTESVLTEMFDINHVECPMANEDEMHLPTYVQIAPSALQDEKFQGIGDYGAVTRANWLGCIVVIKDFPWCGGYTNAWYEEAVPMIRYRHPHVMQLMGFCPDTKKVVTEYMLGGDLRKFIDNRLGKSGGQLLHDGPFSFNEAVDIMWQIAQGLHYIHQKGYMHGDRVLTLNVMVKESQNQTFSAKIGDFGVSQKRQVKWRVDLDKPCPENLRYESVRWTAPEVHSSIQGRKIMHYSTMSDIYGFGILCSEILTGNIPFKNIANVAEVRSLVLAGARPQLPDTLEENLGKLIKDCWQEDCTLRPTSDEVCKRLKQIAFPMQIKPYSSVIHDVDTESLNSREDQISQINGSEDQTPQINGCEDQTPQVNGSKDQTPQVNGSVDQSLKNGQSEIVQSKALERQFSSLPDHLRIPATDLEMGDKLGKGSSGGVYKAKWCGTTCAVKELSELQETLTLQSEVHILTRLNHPNIVQLMGFSPEGRSIIMELMPEDLPSLYKRRLKKMNHQGPPFDYATTLSIIQQMASGMAHLHNGNILHRDLKGKNVLVHDCGHHIQVKIADFGVSQYTNEPSAYRYTGTGFWRPPELLRAIQESMPFEYTTKADVYSFAMTCYEVLVGKTPYEGDTPRDVMEMLVSPRRTSQIPRRPLLPKNDGVNMELLHLIDDCWNEVPDIRPSFIDITNRLQSMLQSIDLYE